MRGGQQLFGMQTIFRKADDLSVIERCSCNAQIRWRLAKASGGCCLNCEKPLGPNGAAASSQLRGWTTYPREQVTELAPVWWTV